MYQENYRHNLAMNLYTVMYRTRRFKEEVFEFYNRDIVHGLVHLYIGEEAVSTGVCAALEDKDFIGSSCHEHGYLVARGADMNRMMAEIMSKKTGSPKGKGNAIHIMALEKGILGAEGIVGSEIPVATGAAYASKLHGSDEVTVAFFEDYASNEGTFHESINKAAAWDLPLVYVIETNLYGISMGVHRPSREQPLSRRTDYGIPGITVDGNDVLAVYEAARSAVERARSGNGPTIVECETYRWQSHHMGHPGLSRPDTEEAKWKTQDPLFRLEATQLLTQEEQKSIRDMVEKEIAEACAFAEQGDFLDGSGIHANAVVNQ